MTARLALESGVVFHGRAFGACADPLTSTGEVVFNTAMSGYQEALTDPSYRGQILVMTAPQIGNYGVTAQDMESGRPQVAGFVIRELARRHSNHRADGDLSGWLAEGGVLGIEGVDTRQLVLLVREHGALRGVVSCDAALSDQVLVERAAASPLMTGRNLAAEAGVGSMEPWTDGLTRWSGADPSPRPSPQGFRVVAIDCGGKRNIYRHLVERGCEVVLVPPDIKPEAIEQLKPAGLFISNGPGDPAAVTRTVQTLARVAGQVPTLGICLGHQLLALALGASTYKLKFGHRGANQPVRNLITDRVEITSQNHGFCVDAASLEGIDCQITHVHLNDGTVAGFCHRSRPLISVQHHPEASPGPHDSAYLFDCFIEMMRTGSPLTRQQMVDAQAAASVVAAAGC